MKFRQLLPKFRNLGNSWLRLNNLKKFVVHDCPILVLLLWSAGISYMYLTKHKVHLGTSRDEYILIKCLLESYLRVSRLSLPIHTWVILEWIILDFLKLFSKITYLKIYLQCELNVVASFLNVHLQCVWKQCFDSCVLVSNDINIPGLAFHFYNLQSCLILSSSCLVEPQVHMQNTRMQFKWKQSTILQDTEPTVSECFL